MAAGAGAASMIVFGIALALLANLARPVASKPASVLTALSTEAFLNHLGVNTHLNGLTASDPWNTNATQVGTQLRYLGVRLDRDWAWSVADGEKWKQVQKAWSPLGRFWTSIDEGSPANQRRDLEYEEAIRQRFPGLIFTMGGPNEEDDAYAQSQGATLPDAALVQRSLYSWAHSGGRNIRISQMEFGAGWTATNGWQGDYAPQETGLGQNYTPGPADVGAAHTYLSNPNQTPAGVLDQLRILARLTTPGKPVAHTEFGAYAAAKLSPAEFGQDMVLGALDSMAAGDAAFIVYGLQDSGPEQTLGFFAFPSGAAHPAARDFHTLTTLLQSARGRYGPGERPTFTPGSLSVSGSNPAATLLLMQKPTGEYVIAAWDETKRNGSQNKVSTNIRFGRAFKTLRVYDVETGTTPIDQQHHVHGYALRMMPNDVYLFILNR